MNSNNLSEVTSSIINELSCVQEWLLTLNIYTEQENYFAIRLANYKKEKNEETRRKKLRK